MKIKKCAAPGIHDKVLKMMKNEKRGKVLDIASGYGNVSYNLSNMGFEVYAADIDPSRFEPKNINCFKVDANKELPWSDEYFDFIVSVETIEHLENPWNFIREAHRVLKPKGKLFLTTPNVESWLSRLFFLFFGHLKLFGKFYADDDHITPIFTWTLSSMIENKFKINDVTYNDLDIVPFIHKIGIWFKPGRKSKLFGYVHIIEMEKL